MKGEPVDQGRAEMGDKYVSVALTGPCPTDTTGVEGLKTSLMEWV